MTRGYRSLAGGGRARGWTAGLVAVLALGTGLGPAAPAGAASSGGGLVRVLPGTLAPLLARSQRLGSLAPQRRIAFQLALALPHRAALDRYVAAEYEPGSTLYHRFLTPAQFAARFGAPVSEVRRVLGALGSLGLGGSASVPANRLYVNLTAPVGTVQRALGTLLERLRLDGRSFYANASAVRLPASLAGLVSGVVGLDSAAQPQPQLAPADVSSPRPLPRARASAGGAQPCLAADLSGGYTAPDLANAYGFGGLYARGLHGEGMSAALVEFDDYHDSNVAGMESCYHISTPVTRRLVDGGVGGPPGPDEAEDMADITTLLEMAPRLAHLYVYEAPITTGATLRAGTAAELDLYNAFVTDDRAPVLSSSWGSCEELNGAAYNQLFAVIAEEAAAQGQQIFDAAGDSGAVDCRGSAPPTLGSISVEQEAAVPWITGVGGTDLSVSSTLAGLHVHREDTWNDAGAGGGGQSAFWPMPSWQQGYLVATGERPEGEANPCGSPSGLCRMVPDIALDADPDAGGLLDGAPVPPQFFPLDVGSPGYGTYCATSNCSFTSLLGLPLPIGGAPPGGLGAWYPIGGTSLATPLAAAAAVLWDQEAREAGLRGLGFLNPLLYRIASDPSRYARDFHDVTIGTNSDQYDGADCPAGCNPGRLYAAGKGYDMASGLGSIDAANLGGDLVASAGALTLTPASETMYGYARGPRTSRPVSLTTGYRSARFRARSTARWLHVVRSGHAPGTLRWYVNPARLRVGRYRGRIVISSPGEAAATLSVTLSVSRRARIATSVRSLRFSEPPISAQGRPASPSCGSTVWSDELESYTPGGPGFGAPLAASSRAKLVIRNRGPRGSVLHYEALYSTRTGGWLSQDLDPGGRPSAFQTAPTQPLVATTGTLAAGERAALALASIANSDLVGGYPALDQGTYSGLVQIRDLADPRDQVRIPVTLILGDGHGTPTMRATPAAVSLTLAPGARRTVDVVLADSAHLCGFAYSIASSASWAQIPGGLEAGTVGAAPASAAPAASDTGAGDGFTPVTLSAAGLRPGTYTARLTVQSENAANNPLAVPIRLTVRR
jgi:hypothetical protein